MTPSASPHARTTRVAVICGISLLTFCLLSWFAVLTKAPTIDEPLHAAGAYVHVLEHDYRVNPEDPPLWNYLAMAPQLGHKFVPDPELDRWRDNPDWISYQLLATTRRLFQTQGNDGGAFVNRSRAAMLVAGLALGVCVTALTWRLAGPTATVVACLFFSFDPNLLAHAPLVKNDVSITLIMLALTWAVWSLGRQVRWSNLLLVLLLCGAAVTTKFSGLLLGPMVLAMLIARALLPNAWTVLGKVLDTRGKRLAFAGAVCLLAAGFSYLSIWACYGFRFDPTSIPGFHLDFAQQIELLKRNTWYVDHGDFPSQEQLETMAVPMSGRLILFARQHHLLPEAWLFGLAFTTKSTLVRESFLLGSYSMTGWWYYFPLAMLFKMPVATIVAVIASIVVLVVGRHAQFAAANDDRRWSRLALSIPVIIYGISALSSNLNLGIRHVLPVYPFIFILIGIAGARLRSQWPGVFKPLAACLIIGLIVESLLAFPHYISFFNAPSRPHRLKLLSDSNFDWSQDLTYVLEWQQRNPYKRLYLGYWGTVDPEFYGIRYINIPGGFVLNPNYEWPPQQSGVIAISATLLQGVNCPPSCKVFYAGLRQRPPREILGDSIYLYDVSDLHSPP
jgi:hypothetical protein